MSAMTEVSSTTVCQIIRTAGAAPYSVTEVPTGLLVTLTESTIPVSLVITALTTSGYTAAHLGNRTLSIGGADPIALLDAQIAALTARRDALTADTWRCTACATYNPNPRQVCDICGYTRTGHDTRKENA